MDLMQYKASFDQLMGAKTEPNVHEIALYQRALKYIKKITWVPGLRMISVVNSLSMNATHEGSDIDLFIITSKNRMWLSRVLITFTFWIHGVWRHHEDIAGNFCLSFWVEENALSLSKIALENDIYLTFWAYYMKPILADDQIWEEFSQSNPEYQFADDYNAYLKYRKKYQNSSNVFGFFQSSIDQILRFFGERKSLYTFHKKGSPEGVIIAADMLKFHDKDQREAIRERILSNSQAS